MGLVPTEVAGHYTVSGSERLELGQDGHLSRLEGMEQLHSGESTGRGTASTTTELNLTRVETGRSDAQIGAFDRAWPWLVTRGPGQPQRAERLAADLDRQTAGRASFEALHAELRGFQGDGAARERALMLPRLEARFRLNPEAAATAARSILAGTETPDTVRTLVGALTGAGTPEAQRALAEVMASSEVDLHTQVDAMSGLGTSKRPTADSIAALSKAMTSDDPLLRDTAVLATGNAARGQAKVGDSNSDALESLTVGLDAAQSDADVASYLRGLGNAGDASTLDLIEGHLASPSAEVRHAAIRALRFQGDQADELLGGLLADFASAPEGDLEAAVFSASFRPLETLLEPIGRALRGSQDESLRRSIVALLTTRRAGHPEATALLQWTAQNDASAALRADAAKALATSTLIPAP